MNKRIKQLNKMLRLEINLPVYFIIFLVVIIIVVYVCIINSNINLTDKIENLSASNQQLEIDLLEVDKLRITNNDLNKQVVDLTDDVKYMFRVIKEERI